MPPPTSKPLSNPFAAAGDRSVGERFASLKLRTALICVAMLLCVAAGWQLLHEPLQSLMAQAWQLLRGQGHLPLPHVPDPDGPGLRSLLQQGTLLGVTALTLIGHSSGAFGQLKLRWALVLPLVVAGVFAWVAPAGHGLLPLLPGPMERDILGLRAEAATRRLDAGEYPAHLRRYVLAQIALRTGDAAALRREGEPVLLQADRVAYGLDFREGLQLDPDIVLAIDKALNGQPETEVGLRRQRETELAGWRNGAVFAGRVLLGAAMVAAAWALLRLWNLMRRRVGTIQQQMQADAEAVLVHEAAALAQAPQPDLLALRHRSQRPTAPPPPVSWRIILRLVVLVAAPVLLVKGLAFWLTPAEFRHGMPDPPGFARLSGGEHPCNLVGAWTSSRGDSVFKVTLLEDGRFTAEPIAAGPYGKGSYRGRWDLIEGKSIRWVDDLRPGDLSDVNPILELDARNFTLREVSGAQTRFNRIGPAPSQKRCSG